MNYAMTEDEIRARYNSAKFREKQIVILAQLNAVKPQIIQEILSGKTWEEARAKPSIAGGIRKRVNWTPNKVKKLCTLYYQKKSQKEMMAQLNCTRSSLTNAINRFVKERREK